MKGCANCSAKIGRAEGIPGVAAGRKLLHLRESAKGCGVAETKNGKLERIAGRARLLLRALSSRNYRLFFFGQSVSLVGTWMQQVAMSWLVYRVSGSALLLGVVGFTSQIPTFLLAPLAGVLADRYDKRKLLLATQALAMLQAVALAFLVFSKTVQVWHIVALSLVLGVVNAFDIPARQSFVVEMVERKEDLANAIALNSSMVNSARLVGPTAAGILIAITGEGVCFLVNAASYLAVLAALAGMRLPPRHRQRRTTHVVHELKEGFLYAWHFVPIRAILMLLSLVSLAGMPYAVLMPVFAREMLGGGAHTYGFLMTAGGVGALGSTLLLASRGTVLGLGRVIPRAAVIFGVGIIIFAFSSTLWISLPALAAAGFGAMAVVACGNTILQTIVEDDKRGRVMSFFTMSFMGMTPFGSLAAGWLATRIGPVETLALGGALCLTGGLLFARVLPRLREMIRPIYACKGIIPEVAEGLEQAAELTIPPEDS